MIWFFRDKKIRNIYWITVVSGVMLSFPLMFLQSILFGESSLEDYPIYGIPSFIALVMFFIPPLGVFIVEFFYDISPIFKSRKKATNLTMEEAEKIVWIDGKPYIDGKEVDL